MRKLLIITSVFVMCLLLTGSVYSYYCINENDNTEVKKFKYKMNILSVENELEEGVSGEAIFTKLKYFSPCKEWQ